MIDVAKESKTWSSLVNILTHAQASKAEDNIELARILVAVAKVVYERTRTDSPGGQCPSVDFFPRQAVGQFIQEILHCVMTDPDVEQCFALANRSVRDLLHVQPLETLTQAILQQCVAVATLPWMDGEQKLSDLRLGETLAHNLITFSAKLCSSCPPGQLPRWAMVGLPLASSLENHVAPKWRLYSLRKAWSSSNAVSRRAVVESLPSWIHCFGASALPVIKEIVGQALEKEESEVLEPLAKISGMLICVQAKQGTRSYSRDGCLKCKVCDKIKENYVPKNILTPPDVEYLVKFVGYHDAKVRLNALHLIRSVANHVGFSKGLAELFLNYLQDDSEECVAAFSKLIGHLVRSDNSAWTTDGKSMRNAVMNAVEDFSKSTLRQASSSPGLVEAACYTLTSLGDAETEDIEMKERVVRAMLTMLLNSNTHVEAYFHFQQFLKANVARHRDIFMKMVALGMCDRTTRVDVLKHVTVLFANASVSRFLREQVHHIIPHLVVETVRRRGDGGGDRDCPVEFLASLTGLKSRHLLAENFQYIFPHLVIHAGEKNEYARLTQFMESEMALPMRQLVPSSRQKIITELMTNFYSHQKRVIQAFQWLCKNDDDFTTNSQMKPTKPLLVQYLLPKFLGVVGYFDQRLRNPHVPDYVKIEILKSLKDIIVYMGGTSIGTVKHKLLSTFKTALTLKIPNIHVYVLKLWEAFVKTIDRSALGSILSQVIANFYPLLEAGCGAEVVALYKYLIVDREKEMKQHFRQLCFVPDLPELHEVNSTIKKANRITENTSFKDILYLTTKSLKNESSEVKLQALRKLKQHLWPNQSKLQELIVGAERADPIVNHIVDLLVSSTLDADPEVAGLAGDCLGHVGAVDPGRLDLVQDLSSNLGVCLTISDDDFVAALISTLIKSFLKCSESADSDACAFALQEVLKACDITGPASFSSPGGRVWNRLLESEQEVVSPFIGSHYCRSEKPVTYKLPVYTSRKGISYEDWLSDWSCHLMSKVKEKKTQAVFCACKAAIRKDTSCGQFVLPYVISKNTFIFILFYFFKKLPIVSC